MSLNNILKFTIAIEDKATEGLDAISNRLKQMEEQFIRSVGNINQSLGNIGSKQSLPNLDELLKQIANTKEALKVDVDKIPMFKSVMDQMQQLQSFVGSSNLPQEIKKMEDSLTNLFKESGRVNPNSFETYFSQLNKAYENFRSKLNNSGTNVNLGTLDEKMSSFNNLRNGGIMQDIQTQAEQIKAVLLKSIQDINESIITTKNLLSRGGGIDFGAVSKKVDSLTTSIEKLTEAFRAMNGVIGQDNGVLNLANGMGTMLKEVNSAVKTLKDGQENLKTKTNFEDHVKSIYQARAELEKLEPLIKNLQSQRLFSKSIGLDTKDVDIAIEKVSILKEKLSAIVNSTNGKLISFDYPNGQEGISTSQLMQAEKANLQSIRNTLDAQTEANSQALKNEQVKKSLSQADERLSEEEQRVANAIRNSTGAMRNQSQVVTDLKSMALQYLSVWGAQQFISDMVNITGELELQKKSLEVILDNASAAQNMYSEIRDLSQMSPYSFEDLLKSHRQLAAFGIEAKDTFNTLKSLSDIGAGLDVDVSRLILAYGHTKSYGYLSGIQNRQFETAGIDLVGALTDMYNKRANERKREGKQYEFVNRKDMFKRMRERNIPFEDVQEVILDLDKPGGKFYNMQIRQFETLGGKLRNLRNNYRIMMSELGGDNKGFLMGMVGFINELTENWQRYINILKGVAIGYASLKLAALLAGRQALSTSKELVSASVLRNRISGTTSYLNGNISMWGAMGSSRKIRRPKSSLTLERNDNIVRNIATDSKINTLTKQRIALTSALTKEQRILLLTENGINQARATQIAGMSAWKRGFLALRLGIIGVAQSFKAMAVAMLTNPMTWVFAAVSAITWLFEKMGQGAEEAENFKKNLSETAETDVKGMNEFLDPYKQSGLVKAVDKTAVKGDGRTAIHETIDVNKVELEAEGIDSVFEELKNKLQTASPIYEGDYFDVMKAKDQVEQVKGMFQKMEDIKFAKQIEQQTSDELGAAVASTAPTAAWHVWEYGRGEGVITNMSDYAKDRADFINSIRVTDAQWNTFSQEDKAAIDKYMRDLGMSRNEAIAKYLINMSTEKKEKLNARREFKNDDVLGEGAHQALKLKRTLNEAKEDIAPVAGSMANTLINKFGDNISAGSAYITDAFNKMLSDAQIGSPEAQAELVAEFNRSLLDSLGAMGKGSYGNAIMKRLYQNEIGKMTLTDLDTKLLPGMSDKAIINTSRTAARRNLEALKLKDPFFLKWFNSLGKKSQEEYVKGIEEAAVNAGKKKVSNILWQKFYIDRDVKVTKSDTDYIDFVKARQEELADKLKRITSQKKHLKDLYHIDVDIDLNSKDAVQKMAKLLLALNKRIHNLWKEHNASTGSKRTSTMRSIYYNRNMRDETLEMYRTAKALKEDHQSLTDNDRGDRSDRINRGSHSNHSNRKNRSGRSNGSHEDPFVKRWDERIRVMKEANDVYEDWEKRLNKSAAIKKVKAQFGDIFEAWRKDKFLPLNFNINNVGDIRKYVEKIRKDAYDRYLKLKKAKKYRESEESLRVYRQTQDVLNSIGKKIFDQSTDLWLSKTNLWLDRLTKKWELYQKILKETGNTRLSLSLSGLNAEKYHSIDNIIKEKIKKDLEEAGATKEFVFDANSSDKQIEDDVKDSLSEKINPERIKGIVEEIKKWRDFQEKIKSEGIETFSTITGGVKTYINQIYKLNSEYDDLIDKMQRSKELGGLNEEQFQIAKQVARDKRDREKYLISIPYKKLVSSTLTNTLKSASVEAEKAISILSAQLYRGSISAEDYTTKIKEINTALDKIDKSNISDIVRFFNETPSQRHARKSNEAMERFVELSNESDYYSSILNKLKGNGYTSSELRIIGKKATIEARKKAALSKAQGENEKANKEEKFAQAVETATKALQGFRSGMELLSKTFAALRMKGAANAASDVADVAGGVLQGASSLSSIPGIGPWGAIAGASLGLIGGIAQLHDKILERQIGEIMKDVENIEAYTEVISKAQERTFGYDKSDELRNLAQRYSQNDFTWGPFLLNKEGAAGQAMKEFYGSAAGASNGYQQQYELLKREREDYVEMYNKKNKEKGDHDKDLLEYKKKIAELDDKLIHFAEDTAKNLWGIDIKGWADQMSDALCNAFENGEDAAKVFKDTTEDILRGIANNIIKIGLLQPMFKELSKKIFGYDDKAGKYHKGVIDVHDKHSFDDPDKTVKMILSTFSTFMKEEGNNILTTVQQTMEAINENAKSKGFNLKKSKDGSDSALSSGIQGMSEDTAGLLAGYVNALRQDVSYIRLLQTAFVNEMWKDYIQQVTGMGGALTRIDENVSAIRSVISENGALYQKVEQMAGDLHNVIFGNQRVKVE